MINLENYSEETQIYIQGVEDYLINKFGELKTNWFGLLSMLATQYDIYVQSRDYIKQNGLLTDGKYGVSVSPMVKVQNDASIQIQKIANALTISPNAENKLKEIAENDDKQEDFINALTSK